MRRAKSYYLATMRESGSQIYDVIIIGGGPAGMASAVWCEELGLNALMIEKEAELGGQLLITYNSIRNYPGIDTANGRGMRDLFLKQIRERNLEPQFNCEVAGADLAAKRIKLSTGKVLSAKALIIATGVRRRKLNVQGEDKFQDRGIVRSGARDAPNIKGKRVCVVGGGDAAFENALILSKYAEKVTLIHRSDVFRARREFVERVRQNGRIRIESGLVVTELIGDETLESIRLLSPATGRSFIFPADALLLRLGVEPNTSLFAGQIDLNAKGYIKIDSTCQTSAKNVYAVGDIANPLAATIAGAVGMGATAAKVIAQTLSDQELQ